MTSEQPVDPTTSPPRRSVASWAVPLGIGIAIVALVVIALNRQPVSFDPTSPEGTVQEYLEAISNQDWEAAFAVLDPASFVGCGPDDLAMVQTGPFVAAHDSTFKRGPETIVTVRISESSVLTGGWQTWAEFALIERDRLWYITGDPWPYFYWNCAQG